MEFKTLNTYHKAKDVYKLICDEIISKLTDRIQKDQLRQASLSIVLNIAEDSSRITNADQRHFYVMARGSTYECYVIIDLLNSFENDSVIQILEKLEEVSKMLYGLIKKYSAEDSPEGSLHYV